NYPMTRKTSIASGKLFWLICLLVIIALVVVILRPVFKPTAQEKLAQTTVSGDASSGYYPYCSDDSLTKPGYCRDLRRLDSEYVTRKIWSVESQRISHDGQALHLGKLVSPNGRDAFFNSITISPDGSPIAVGGPSLLVARANPTEHTWEVQKFSRFADTLRDIAFHGNDIGLAVGSNGL